MAYNGYLSEVYSSEKLNELIERVKDEEKARVDAENELLGIQISNAEKLYRLQIQQINKAKDQKLAKEQEVNEKLLKMGFKTQQILDKKSSAERLKLIDKEEKKRLAHAKKDDTIKKIKAEYEEKRKQEKKFQEEKARLETEQNKKTAKENKKLAQSTYGTLGNTLFDIGGAHKKEIVEKLKDEGATDEEIAKALKDAKGQAIYDALSSFAKQLEGTINDIAGSQTEIDTRLQGSRSKTVLGSYWKKMSSDIVKYVGMSPYIKQSDVTANLKTMVGQGIAFNVEQRAFLETISDKIATTFSATDSTLLKLVRIQQEDTTAARLGMESALTSFLNNMYETTEYMQSAASEIRQNLYEASALMTAKSATEFEYQVQKWMGSLYSVGFSNTTGLSGALGKLAAGDISSIANGGFGNLLVMAANRANLSIADVLSKGLDESETNTLMQAMVNYLGQIYNETKGSNILAQQYAGVFGLTASDLKAAANLAQSVGNISSNGLNYGGMLTQLTNMAKTMGTRTSIGGMMTNVFDNLKYATANSMANNPLLYATYTLASMLDSTVGGISIPSFNVMGTGFDLETTVADLMRVASLGGGLLSGIGTMLHGLGQSGSGAGMLRGFGVGTNSAIVSRGTGAGLLTTSGGTTSESGSIISNSSGSDVQSKTIGDASDEANAQMAQAVDPDAKELKDVDASILQIYDLLQKVTTGSLKFHVDIDDTASWTVSEDGKSMLSF